MMELLFIGLVFLILMEKIRHRRRHQRHLDRMDRMLTDANRRLADANGWLSRWGAP